MIPKLSSCDRCGDVMARGGPKLRCMIGVPEAWHVSRCWESASFQSRCHLVSLESRAPRNPRVQEASHLNEKKNPNQKHVPIICSRDNADIKPVNPQQYF